MQRITRRALSVALLALPALGGQAMAQGKYPDGPIRMIVPFAPGGGVDNAARLIAKQLGTNLGVPVVVEIILERVTNIAMGVEIDGVNEFEALAEAPEDAPGRAHGRGWRPRPVP